MVGEGLEVEKRQEKFWEKLVSKLKATPGAALGGAKEHAKSIVPFLFLIVGLVYHSLHYLNNGWGDLPIQLISITGILMAIVIVLSGLGNYKEGVRNLIFLLIAIGFEVFYYTILTSSFDNIPRFLDKVWLWNGFIIAAGFSGFNEEKTFYKYIIYYFVLLLFGIIATPMVTAMAKGVGLVKTTEVGEGDIFNDLRPTTADSALCVYESGIQDISQAKCLLDKKWQLRASSEQKEAMIKLCEEDDSRCECEVYPAGEKRDECEKKQAEIKEATKEIKGGEKERTPMEIVFDLPKVKPIRSYGLKVKLDANLKVLTPYKAVNIEVDCVIENGTKGNIKEISSTINNKKVNEVQTFPPMQTDQTSQSRRISCQSVEDMGEGEYKFNLTATVNNIKTESYFIGLYAKPIDVNTKGSQFEAFLESAMNDAYGGKTVQSFSDPDLTLLNFLVVPDFSLVEDNKVSALSNEEEYKHFTIEVSLENNREDSEIKSVSSLEFRIPEIFNMDKSCTDIYDSKGSEGGFLTISAKTSVLEKIKFDSIQKGKKPEQIGALNCRLMANRKLQGLQETGVVSKRFEGTITYAQEIKEIVKVTQVG